MMAKTNEPVIDLATMSPQELCDAYDSQISRPLIVLAIPDRLQREQKKDRDHFDLQHETRMKDDNKPQVFYKQSDEEKFLKTNFVSTRQNIKKLTDETNASFNLKEKTYEYLEPQRFIKGERETTKEKIIKGKYNRHDLPENIFFKYGDELFPEDKEKDKKGTDKSKSPQKHPKSIVPIGAG